jgi:hypothetical protein
MKVMCDVISFSNYSVIITVWAAGINVDTVLHVTDDIASSKWQIYLADSKWRILNLGISSLSLIQRGLVSNWAFTYDDAL